MKLLTQRLAGVLVMGAAAITAFAGTHTSQQVFVTFVGSKPYATGDLGYVHNTPDTTQYIGCEVSNLIGNCYARDVNGVFASCVTQDLAMLEVMRSINGDGNLLFTWNTDGTCRVIKLLQDSRTAPK